MLVQPILKACGLFMAWKVDYSLLSAIIADKRTLHDHEHRYFGRSLPGPS